MKSSTIAVAVTALVLAACQTAPTKTADPIIQERIVEKVVYKEPSSIVMSNIPDWMAKLPKESGYMFASGTARSQDYSMAVEKAKTVAQSKLAELLGVKVDKQTKIFQSDKNGNYYENSSTAIRKSVEEITMVGAEVVETKVVMEAPNVYRAFILMTIKGEEQKQVQVPVQSTEDDDEKNAFDQLGKKKVSLSKPEATSQVTQVVIRPASEIDQSKMITSTISDQSVKSRVAETMKDPNAVVMNTTIR